MLKETTARLGIKYETTPKHRRPQGAEPKQITTSTHFGICVIHQIKKIKRLFGKGMIFMVLLDLNYTRHEETKMQTKREMPNVGK
jgi:hypothetical protein